MTTHELEFTFKAMNTDIKIIATGVASTSIQQNVRQLFEKSEERFSRFIESSELSELNRNGELNQPTEMMLDVLQSSIRYFRKTGGAFNPTILNALESAGYDRSFDTLDQRNVTTKSPASGSIDLNESLEIDYLNKRVRSRNQLDLGGIVKGWTVDHAATLMRTKCDGWLIDAGGDILTGGSPSGDQEWTIGIDDPFTENVLADAIQINNCAVATSSTLKRKWQANGRHMHHIIDPNTSRPSSSDLAAVNVIARNAEMADVLATASLVLGQMSAEELLTNHGAAGRFTHHDGLVAVTRKWPSILNNQNTAISSLTGILS